MRPILILVSLVIVACAPEAPPRDEEVPTEPVYYGEVDRILAENCVECHSASPDRLAPFSLATYDDAVASAENAPIAFAVMNRMMPPYFADDSGSCRTYHDNKWLTDDQIAALVAWTNGARAAGDPARASPPADPLPALVSVDAVLDLGGDYLPTQSVDDEYRCFVVDPGQTTDQFLTGFHVHPGNASVVHHVIVFSLPDAAAADEAVALDAAAPGLGYPCQGGAGPAGAAFLLGWAPGNQAVFFPTETGIRIASHRQVVMQIHYNLAGSDGLPDRTTVDFQLAGAVVDEARIVGIPASVNLPPGQSDVTAVGSINVPLGRTGRVWGTAMHMHQRGTGGGVAMRGESDACLLDLANWSFHWQHFYWFDEPAVLSGGEQLEVTCRYDTSDDTAPVTWGEGTADEMCLAYLYVSE